MIISYSSTCVFNMTACIWHVTFCCDCFFRAGLNRYVHNCFTVYLIWIWIRGERGKHRKNLFGVISAIFWINVKQLKPSSSTLCGSSFWGLKKCLRLLVAPCRWRRRSAWRISTRHFRASLSLCRRQPREPCSNLPKNASTTYSWWAIINLIYKMSPLRELNILYTVDYRFVAEVGCREGDNRAGPLQPDRNKRFAPQSSQRHSQIPLFPLQTLPRRRLPGICGYVTDCLWQASFFISVHTRTLRCTSGLQTQRGTKRKL